MCSYRRGGKGVHSGDGVGDVEIFAVAATDGLLDFVTVENMARHVAKGLYEADRPHLIIACEELIGAAAGAWRREKRGRYRDDIAIVVSRLT